MTETICSITEMKQQAAAWRGAGQLVGFVPTMGALHEGHLSLIRLAKERATRVVVSIFVNSKQFNVAEDLKQYPRDEASDRRLLEELGVDAIFMPSEETLYPEGFRTTISVDGLTSCFEGAGRPGHFAGVTTVVALLFALVKPSFAVFGEKDFQQLRVIEQLVADLHLDLEIVRGPLVREEDGLALSSRNVRLSSAGREKALLLSKSLFAACELFIAGERESKNILGAASNILAGESAIELQYLELVRESDLEPIQTVAEHPARLLVAATIDGLRLIDNMACVAPR